MTASYILLQLLLGTAIFMLDGRPLLKRKAWRTLLVFSLLLALGLGAGIAIALELPLPGVYLWLYRLFKPISGWYAD